MQGRPSNQRQPRHAPVPIDLKLLKQAHVHARASKSRIHRPRRKPAHARFSLLVHGADTQHRLQRNPRSAGSPPQSLGTSSCLCARRYHPARGAYPSNATNTVCTKIRTGSLTEPVQPGARRPPLWAENPMLERARKETCQTRSKLTLPTMNASLLRPVPLPSQRLKD